MSIHALAIAPDGSVYAAASRGRILRFVDGEWEVVRRKGERIERLWVSPVGTLYLAGKTCYRLVDGKFRKQPVRINADEADPLMTVWGTSDSNVWVGGFGPEVARFDGSSWTTMDTGLPEDGMYIAGIAGTATWVVAAGEAGAAVSDGDEWRPCAPDSCFNGATPFERGVALSGVGSGGPQLVRLDRDGLHTIELHGQAHPDEELQQVAARGSELFVTSGRALIRVHATGAKVERVCEKFDCYAVASDGERVVTATCEGLWIFDEQTWSLHPIQPSQIGGADG